MPRLTVLGNDPTAFVLRLACTTNGLNSITQITADYSPSVPATILPANISKIITALIPEQELKELSTLPDRKHIRLAKSGYVISEIPLGNFYLDRYGANLYNINESDLIELLNNHTLPSPIDTTAQHKSSTDLLAVTSNTNDQSTQTDQFYTYYAEIPHDKKSSLINTTWISEKQVAHQFNTNKSCHVVFLSPSNLALNPSDWHPTVREAAESAKIRRSPSQRPNTKNQASKESSVVELGAAWYPSSWLLPESVHLGIEDAWVLSRMLENYEDDIDSALTYYVKYRKIRLARLRRQTDQEFTRRFDTKGIKKLGQHISLAFSTRFIPEIYMNDQDWFHGYDCLRGFR